MLSDHIKTYHVLIPSIRSKSQNEEEGMGVKGELRKKS